MCSTCCAMFTPLRINPDVSTNIGTLLRDMFGGILELSGLGNDVSRLNGTLKCSPPPTPSHLLFSNIVPLLLCTQHLLCTHALCTQHLLYTHSHACIAKTVSPQTGWMRKSNIAHCSVPWFPGQGNRYHCFHGSRYAALKPIEVASCTRVSAWFFEFFVYNC